ncbi:MAG TPA: hypothetical protein VID71_10875 [Steroidobacteraceae bacterium]|jgi:hypothetical protein
MSPATDPKAPRELKLSTTLQELVKTAFDRGRPISVAYTDPQGHPQISFRGSLQPHSDTALAIWVRNPDSGILKAVRAGHEHIVALYGDPTAPRSFLSFRGRARIDNSDAERRRVYDSAPAGERARDPEQKGVPLIIELDSVEGLFQGEFLQMRR